MGLSEEPNGSLCISESRQGKISQVLFNNDATKFGADQLADMEKRKTKAYPRTPDEKTGKLFSN